MRLQPLCARRGLNRLQDRRVIILGLVHARRDRCATAHFAGTCAKIGVAHVRYFRTARGRRLFGYLVIPAFDAGMGGAFEIANVSHTFQPSARFLAPNSP